MKSPALLHTKPPAHQHKRYTPPATTNASAPAACAAPLAETRVNRAGTASAESGAWPPQVSSNANASLCVKCSPVKPSTAQTWMRRFSDQRSTGLREVPDRQTSQQHRPPSTPTLTLRRLNVGADSTSHVDPLISTPRRLELDAGATPTTSTPTPTLGSNQDGRHLDFADRPESDLRSMPSGPNSSPDWPQRPRAQRGAGVNHQRSRPNTARTGPRHKRDVLAELRVLSAC